MKLNPGAWLSEFESFGLVDEQGRVYGVVYRAVRRVIPFAWTDQISYTGPAANDERK